MWCLFFDVSPLPLTALPFCLLFFPDSVFELILIPFFFNSAIEAGFSFRLSFYSELVMEVSCLLLNRCIPFYVFLF